MNTGETETDRQKETYVIKKKNRIPMLYKYKDTLPFWIPSNCIEWTCSKLQ